MRAKVALGEDYPPGDATLAIRWETVLLGPTAPPAPGENRFPALIETAVFHGERHEVILRVGDLRLTALTQAKRGLRPKTGDHIEIALDSADIVVIVD